MKVLKIVLLVVFIGLGCLLSGCVYQDELEKEIAKYQKEIQIDPKNADAHHNLRVVYHQQGKIDDAIIFYQKIIGTDPNNINNIDVYINLGHIYLGQGKYEDAIAE